MADSDDSLGDLSAREGISNYTIDVDGLDKPGSGGAVVVRFRIEQFGSGGTMPARFAFTVPPASDGLEGAIVRAYDQLIPALRQMLFHAARARERYKSISARLNPSGSPSENANET